LRNIAKKPDPGIDRWAPAAENARMEQLPPLQLEALPDLKVLPR
jgi:hypothetical protein